VPPAAGDLLVSPARLVWAAATVGATPISLGGVSRPYLELSWRVALAIANIEEDVSSRRWVRTAAYDRLDPSEKSAVSYGLGMTQAKITCEMLLGVPHLVHLDAVLALLGASTQRSRPDFVGFDLATMTYTVGVEAKGRSNGWTQDVTTKAKRQASLLPLAVGATSSLRIASVAYFNEDACWEAYLEDPPSGSTYGELEGRVTSSVLLAAYYRPLVAAVLAEGITQDPSSDDQTYLARLPAVDIWLGLPRVIVDIFRPFVSGPLTDDVASAIGADLLGVVSELPGKAAAGAAPEVWESRAAAEAVEPDRCTGYDGVSVRLGPSWRVVRG
jgi:hypothetical protein